MANEVVVKLRMDGENLIVSGLGKVNTGLSAMGSSAVNAGEKVNAGMSAARRGVQSISTQLEKLQSYAAGYIGFQALTSLAKQAMEASLSTERMSRTIEFASSSAKDYAVNTNYLRSKVSELGLELVSAGTAFAQLNAAAKNTALEGEGARSIFDAVAKASTVMGLSADDTAGSLRAINQMISKGTVSSEELRGQLGERLPGAFQTAARAMGVTTQELGKLLEQGAITTDVFLPRFAAQMRTEMAGSVQAASDSVQANLNRVKGRWTQLLVTVNNSEFSNESLKGIDQFLQILTSTLAKSGTDFKGWSDTVADTLAFVGDAAASAINIVNAVGNAYGGTAALAMLWVERTQALNALKWDNSPDHDKKVKAIQDTYTASSQAIRDGMNQVGQDLITGSSRLRDELALRRADIAKAANDPDLKKFNQRAADAVAAADQALLAGKVKLGGIKKDASGISEAAKGLAEYNQTMAESSGLSSTFLKESAQIQAANKAGLITDLQMVTVMEAKIKKQPYMIEAARNQAEASKEAAKADEKAFKAMDDLRVASEKQITTAATTLGQIEFETRLLDLNTEARAIATMERELERQGIVKGTAAYDDYIANLREAMAIKTGKEAGIKAADDMREAQKKAAEESSKYWEDALMRAFESGKGFFQSLWDTIKNTLKTQVLKVTVQGVMGTLGMGAAGSAMAGESDGSGGLFSMLSQGKSAWDAITSGSGSLPNSLIDGAANIGDSLLQNGFEAAGNAVYDFADVIAKNADLIQGAGQVLGYASALNSAMDGKWGKAAGEAIGTYLLPGIGTIIGSTIGGFVDDLFGGGGGPKVESSYGAFAGLGNTSATGMAGTYAKGVEDAWTTLAKQLEVTSAIKVGALTSIDPQGDAQTIVRANATLNGTQVYNRSDRYGENVDNAGRTEAELQAVLAEETTRILFAALKASDLPEQYKTYLNTVGDSVAEMTSAMSTVMMVDDLTDALEKLPFLELRDLSFDAAVALSVFSGGMDALKTNLGTYYTNFYSAEEQRAQAIANINAATAGSGLDAATATRESFRAIVEAQDVTTESGQKTYAALLSVSGAFAALNPIAEAAAVVVRSASDILTERTRLQDQYDSLTMNSVQLLAKQRSAIDASNTSLFDQVQALEAQKAASEAASTALQAASTALQAASESLAQTLQTLVDASRGGLDTAVGNLQAAYSAEAASITATQNRFESISQTYRNFADGLVAAVASPAESLERLQAQYTRLTDLARLGDADAATQAVSVGAQLKDSIVARSANSTDAALSIARLQVAALATADIADQQASIAEQSLSALTEQVSALITLNDSVLSVASAVNAFKTAQADYDKVQNQYLQNIALGISQAYLAGNTQGALTGVGTLVGTQGMTAEQISTALTGTMTAAQIAALTKISDVNTNGIITAAEVAVATSVQSSAEASVAAEKANLNNNATLSNTITTGVNNAAVAVTTAAKQAETLYATLLGRPLGSYEIATLDASPNFTAAELTAMIMASQEYAIRNTLGVDAQNLLIQQVNSGLGIKTNIKAFDQGTNYLPSDMVAQVHAGERIIPAADNRELMARLQSPSSNNDALVAEIRALRQEVAELRKSNSRENTAIMTQTALTADATRRMDKNGVLVYTDPAEPLTTQAAA